MNGDLSVVIVAAILASLDNLLLFSTPSILYRSRHIPQDMPSDVRTLSLCILEICWANTNSGYFLRASKLRDHLNTNLPNKKMEAMTHRKGFDSKSQMRSYMQINTHLIPKHWNICVLSKWRISTGLKYEVKITQCNIIKRSTFCAKK